MQVASGGVNGKAPAPAWVTLPVAAGGCAAAAGKKKPRHEGGAR